MPFRRIFSYFWILIKRYQTAFFSQFFLYSGRVLLSNILIGYIYKNIIDILGQDSMSIEYRYQASLFFLLALGVSFTASMTVSRYGDLVSFRFVSKMIKDIYDFSFDRLSRHSYNFYVNNFTGSLVAKVKRFARSFEVVNESLISFWMIVVAVVASVITLYLESSIIALYFLGWCFLYLLISVFFVKQKINLDLAEAKSDSKVTGVLADVITNMLNMKIFSSFRKEFSYFKDVTGLVRDTIWATLRFTFIRSLFQASMMISFHVFILYTLLNLWKEGEVSIGVLVMAYSFMIYLFDRIWDLSSIIAKFMKAMTDSKEIVDIFDQTPDITDVSNPEKCLISKGNINFEKVDFEYIEGHNVFSDFNLTVSPGEKVGLVGHSGSGKSTIVKMLLRFSEVQNGQILIDGQDIRNISQDDLRSKITYVPQEPVLFHRTIKENIAYGRPESGHEEIISSAEKAHAHEFISGLQYGYDTLVGERGVKLSGGERQRVAIARAMLKDSPILILDEATSSLDSISESYIQDAFGELMKGRTTIVIAHRLSTIQKMDRIIVLNKGKIVEEGTHKELLEKDGFYADLWNHQTGSFLE